MSTVGLLLAGGRSRRMGGGDKTLRFVDGVTLLDRVIARLRPQVGVLVLNANGDPARFSDFGLPVVPDNIAGFVGPLAGVLAGLDWAVEHAPGCSCVVTVAADAPFLPKDLVVRLTEARDRAAADLACAASDGRSHPVFGLWPVRLRDDLRQAITEEGVRKVDQWTARHRLVTVSFAHRPVDPFFNANRPEDLEAAAALVAAEREIAAGGMLECADRRLREPRRGEC